VFGARRQALVSNQRSNSPSDEAPDPTEPVADVCLIIEGGYPYELGGVASWSDALIRASSGLKFHVIAISIASQPRIPKFPAPDNLLGVTDVILDVCPIGRPARRGEEPDIARAVKLMQSALTDDNKESFCALIDFVGRTGLGRGALLDSKPAWTAMERVYRELLPNGPLIDFFWSWRFLAHSLLSVINTTLPRARIFHAVATGYCGLVGAYAKHAAGRPFIVTEHGIYTNERRIELSVAEWLFDSGAGGYSVSDKPAELRDVWLGAFNAFSRISYGLADIITTQYKANQDYQRWDGAPQDKLRIIPNGIDVDRYAAIRRCVEPRPLTVLMIGRIVPIKDTRTFITAIGLLKELVPGAAAIIIGPENEDPAYAAGCRDLVAQFGLENTLQFLARVPDVADYLARADVLALTSISEAQPIALLEAAAVGLPAVTTDVGSCRDIIEGFADDPVTGAGGIVVDACDAEGVAKALAAILLDDDMRASMGDVMRRRAANYYHKDRVRKLYEDMYAAAIGRREHAGLV
jgi:polysaccharide biosynthesis protein PelF